MHGAPAVYKPGCLLCGEHRGAEACSRSQGVFMPLGAQDEYIHYCPDPKRTLRRLSDEGELPIRGGLQAGPRETENCILLPWFSGPFILTLYCTSVLVDPAPTTQV